MNKKYKKISRDNNIDSLLNLIIEERRRSGLMPRIDNAKFKSEFKSQFNLGIMQCADEFGRRLRQGVSAIWDWLEQTANERESADKTLQEINDTLIALKREKPEDTLIALEDRARSSESLRNCLGLSDQNIEHFYRAAFTYNQQEQYEKSADSFYFLCVLDPLVYSFWLGYGHSEQMLQRFTPALYAYAMASFMEAENPTPHYFAAVCYDKLANVPEALNSLNLAIACPHTDQHAAILRSASELKRKLSHNH